LLLRSPTSVRNARMSEKLKEAPDERRFCFSQLSN
jgi:hypothetical protein